MSQQIQQILKDIRRGFYIFLSEKEDNNMVEKVYKLYYYEKKPTSVIAKMLGISEAKVCKILDLD